MFSPSFLYKLRQQNIDFTRSPTQGEKDSIRLYNQAQSYRDKYLNYFSSIYKRSKPRNTKDFLGSMIQALYLVHPFSEVYYTTYKNFDGLITHCLYFNFKEVLPNDGTLMSGLILDFEYEFAGNWIMGKKGQLFYSSKQMLDTLHSDERYTKVAQEDLKFYPTIELMGELK